MRMRQKYLLEWLDILIGETLNPEKTPIGEITEQQVSHIIPNINKEAATIKSKLKYRVFSLNREKKVRLLVQNHYASIKILLSQVSQHQKDKVFQRNDLKQVMDVLEKNLRELLFFLETWFARYLALDKLSKRMAGKPVAVAEQREKVLCNLSTDQTALVLRAADELRIIQARSMRRVFKTITPYLSTPHREHLSYDAMRVSAYKAEDKDKEVAIAQLKRMIEKIKGY